MNDLLLLDTSVWVLSFKKSIPHVFKEDLEKFLIEKKIVITQLIILEIISGARNQKEYDELLEDFSTIECIEITSGIWQKTYKISFNMRRRGHTIPYIDILIASVCLHYNYTLVHSDRHYEIIKNYYPLQTKYIK